VATAVLAVPATVSALMVPAVSAHLRELAPVLAPVVSAVQGDVAA
jgi:hypothetical protein